jgi:hypothetical protein
MAKAAAQDNAATHATVERVGGRVLLITALVLGLLAALVVVLAAAGPGRGDP